MTGPHRAAGTIRPGHAERSVDSGLVAASGVMALGTLASRVTGFLRTAVLAAALGSQQLADAYNVPNAAPNALYDLLLGGVLTSVVVPLLVRAAKEDSDGGVAYAQRFLTLVAVFLGACTVCAVLAAPWIIDVYANRLSGQQRDLAIVFARYFLPQIFFYGLSATVGAILNSRGKFAAPMWTPVINNVVLIITGLLFLAMNSGHATVNLTTGEQVLLGVGTTGGIVAQTLALWPSLRATGFRWRPRFDWWGMGLAEIARLAGWVVVYVVVNQIGFAVVTNLASAAGRVAAAHHISHGDSYAAYAYAYQIFQLPYAIVAVSVITALLPRMSAHAVDRRTAEVRRDLSVGLRLSGVAVVPAAIAFIALAPEITGIIFAHGNTSAADARYIGWLLVAFATGLVPFCLFQLFTRVFYALRDTRTPALINLLATAANIAADVALYLVLPPGSRAIGLAAGFSLSYWIACALLGRAARVRLGGVDGRRVTRTYVRLVVAGTIAGIVAFSLARLVHLLLGTGLAPDVVAIVAGGGIGAGIFGALLVRMRVSEAGELLAAVRARFGSR